MSTIKADAVTAVSTNADLSLDGLGTGGVSIASTLKMTKGGDIASASPLVIDTDGNYFDVSGTTNFSAMTVESGNFFMLQFDSALTITHGSGIELPGAANLTTATGDRLICYATAANTVEVMSVETEAAASAGGGFSWVEDEDGATAQWLTFSHVIEADYDYLVQLSQIQMDFDRGFQLQYGTGGGPTFQTSGYECTGWLNSATSVSGGADLTSGISLLNPRLIGGQANEEFSGEFHVYNPAKNAETITRSRVQCFNSSAADQTGTGGGRRTTSEVVTAIRVGTDAGSVTTGRASLFRRKLS